jgi:predicted transcriptional regulator
MAWEVLDRLYEKGYIGDPKGKAKSVILTEAGEKLSEELFFKYFGASK